jgi:hypothetical protein
MTAFLFRILVCMLISGASIAQTACPQGVAAGSAQCGPSSMVEPTSSGVPTSPAPIIKWADSWGAIAIDDVRGEAGIVTDLPSKRKAKKAAIAECRRRGGEKCSVTRVFVNQCAAVVANSEMSSSVNAPSVEEAIATGMRRCSESGTADCHVYWSGCSMAKRVW